jgi:hypothetical protein
VRFESTGGDEASKSESAEDRCSDGRRSCGMCNVVEVGLSRSTDGNCDSQFECGSVGIVELVGERVVSLSNAERRLAERNGAIGPNSSGEEGRGRDWRREEKDEEDVASGHGNRKRDVNANRSLDTRHWTSG